MGQDFSGSSKSSLKELRTSLDAAVKGKSANEIEHMARDLFAVVVAFDASTALRRAVTDPARDESAKSTLVKDVFSGSLSGPAVALTQRASSLRWSTPGDIADAVEKIAIETLAVVAEVAETLEKVEEELFAVIRILSSEKDLQSGLNDAKFTEESKRALITSVFGTSLSAHSMSILNSIVVHRRGRSLERTMALYAQTIVARKNRTIARVISATPLDQNQRDRIGKSLERVFDRKIRINVTVDPSILGGMSIRVGDELIEGSILSRLVEAGRALSGRRGIGQLSSGS
jgi:F-type H+-transporting ATPase subunit delta